MAAHKAFYEGYWDHDKAAPEKDPTTKYRADLLLSTLRKQMFGGTISVLDAGCGHGYFTNLLREEGYHTIGIDISDKAIEKARGLYPGIDFKVCSLENRLPFEDETFDVIWSTEVIEHIFDVYTYLQEVNRALKPNGFFIITTPYHGLIKNLAIVLFGFDKHFCNIEGGHIRFFSSRCLKRLFERFSFEVIEKKYIGRIWPICKSIFLVGKKLRDVR